jgi:hypothetical protein
MSYLFSDKVGFKDDAIDAFGRLKVSQPFTVFDSQHRYQENDKWDTSLSGGGSKSYSAYESVVNLNVDTVSGSKVIRETKRVFPYQPGKSLLILSTFAFAAAQSNLRQRVGYFGSQNGIYLEQDGSNIYLVLRTYVSGSVDDSTYKVAKSSWNGDVFDGTGKSGRNLDITKANIMFIEIEWLGVGDVRVGFIVDGRPVVAHTFHNDNLRTTTYMTTACLPLRMEIENTGSTSSSSTAKQICNSVMSEAGYEGFQRQFNVGMGTTIRNLSTGGTVYPVISIRLNSSRLDSIVIPASLSAIVTSNTWLNYKVVFNGTFGGTAPTWSTHSNNNVDYVVHNSGTTLTGYSEIVGGYINNDGNASVSDVLNFNYQLGRTISGTSDVCTVMFSAYSNNIDVIADLAWRELI